MEEVLAFFSETLSLEPASDFIVTSPKVRDSSSGIRTPTTPTPGPQDRYRFKLKIYHYTIRHHTQYGCFFNLYLYHGTMVHTRYVER
jgi:hypothetical protein